jgi:hypothetical protein
VRAVLITYGTAAYTYLIARAPAGGDPQMLGGVASAQQLVLIGLGLQLLLLAVRALIKRYAPDHAAAQSFLLLDLIGDGVTVLLFAIGTLGAILPTTRDL